MIVRLVPRAGRGGSGTPSAGPDHRGRDLRALPADRDHGPEAADLLQDQGRHEEVPAVERVGVRGAASPDLVPREAVLPAVPGPLSRSGGHGGAADPHRRPLLRDPVGVPHRRAREPRRVRDRRDPRGSRREGRRIRRLEGDGAPRLRAPLPRLHRPVRRASVPVPLGAPPPDPKTSVLGHSLYVAILSYLSPWRSRPARGGTSTTTSPDCSTTCRRCSPATSSPP